MSFETMGTSAAQLSNVARPLRGTLRPKGNGVSSSDYPEGKKANKSNVMERQGATLAPVMSHVQQIDPCASSVGRAMYNIPSVSSKNGMFGSAVTRASSR